MRLPRPRALVGLLAANLAGTLLLAALLRLLAAAPPVSAEAARVSALAPNAVSLIVSAATNSGQPGVANNGDTITYTLRLINTGGSLANVQLLDTLPFDALTNITCLDACDHIATSQLIPEPLGGTLLVTVTRQLSWTVASLPPGSTFLQFTARVAGQADGTIITNTASVLKIDGSFVSGITGNAAMTVRVPIPNRGQAEVSGAATWFSNDLGGTLSQDWGDINRDGYMDLVLGSSVGTSVYINENGRLRLLWSIDKRTYGVRFADFNSDGRLDIVAVGDSVGGQANQPGTNYIFGQSTAPTTLSPTFGISWTFPSTFQLVRVGVGDFDLDGDVDVAASTNSINASCPVLMYWNFLNPFGAFFPTCISTTATAAIGPGDFDNDGDLDLALGLFPDTIKVFVNNGGNLSENNTVLVDDNLPFLPYDFAWGDYSVDGKLDLAAAFPLQKEARVFRNTQGELPGNPQPFDTSAELVFRTASFLTPLSVDWGDFNGDGLLDLMVADEAPKVYLNQPPGASLNSGAVLASDTQLGQKWGLRAADMDLGGDLSLAITNRDRASLLLEGFASHLSTRLTALTDKPSGSVAWGDTDDDDDLDLVLGAGEGAFATTVYYNFRGTLSSTNTLDLAFSGIGPHHVALGDVDGDRRLEIAIGTPGGAQLYQPGASQTNWSADASSRVAFTDANSDGRLDLLSATAGGGIALYLNQNGLLNNVAAFTTQEAGDVRGLAVADFNRDLYPDFAVAFINAPARVYLNNKNNTFTPVWNSGTISDTRSVAWGDFNVDGYVDLAVGHYQAGTQLFRNMTGTLSATPLWTSPTLSRTTALAWGDWDNDGYPDLAIGNEGEPTQVYGNLASEANLPRLFWLWTSQESYNTTGLAWGDVDGDSDLDLGYSQGGSGFSGYYRNGTILPSQHLPQFSDYLRTMPLPNNPPYVDVQRPGATSNAYLWSSSEVLALGVSPTVTIVYTQYDPDGARRQPETAGDPLARTFFEFSLDGGSTWKRASAAAGAPPAATATSRTGVAGTFVWDARRDKAISDDARFRIRVVPQLRYGPTQRASTIGVSPPFRVRALTAGCIWPDGPNIAVSASPPVPTATTYLTGSLLQGTGPLTYTWQFSDFMTPTLGQITNHKWVTATTYAVTLTVTGPACPVTRPVVVTRRWGQVTSLTPVVYVPLMLNRVTGAASSAEAAAAEVEATATGTPTAEATLTQTATPTATASETASPTATATGTDPPTEAPTATATDTATAEPSETAPPEPDATGTPTETIGVSLAGSLLPLSGPSIHTNQGQPTLRTTEPQVAAAAGTTSLLFITTPDKVGISNEPSVSGDGKYIAFWSTANLVPGVGNLDGNIELFLAQKGSPVQFTQVTNSTGSILGGFNLSPSIDQSGTRVAFFSDRDLIGQNPESSFQIFLYDSTIPALTQVTTRTRGFNILPSLSGNGQFIAFVSDRNYAAASDGNSPEEGNTEIARAELGVGGAITLIQVTTTTNEINDQPRISFDGSRIAFISTADLVPGQNSDHNREVFVAEILAGGAISYTQVSRTDAGTTGQIAISGDGRFVTFVSDQDPTGDNAAPPCTACRVVYVASLDGSANPPIAAMSPAASNQESAQPSISSDGTRIAYLSITDNQLVLRDTVSGQDSTIDVPASSLNPVISAGGTAVAFAADKQILWAEFPLAELSVAKTVQPAVAFPGDLLRYTIVVSNAGPSLATGVVMTDVISGTQLIFPNTPDQLDSGGGAGGFGGPGSTFINTSFNNPMSLTLASGNSGAYTSRIMDAGLAAPWTQLAWTPRQPYGKPLPDNGATETAYSQGNANMSSALALLHLDETGSPQSFQNTATSVSPPGTCTGAGCPTPAAAGLINGAAAFDGFDDYAEVNVLPASSGYAVAFWFKSTCSDCGLYQVAQGQLGVTARDRQVLLDAGRVCAVLNGETICSAGTYNDGQWHQVAHIYGDPGQNSGGQVLFVDGTSRATGAQTDSSVLQDAVVNVGYAVASPSEVGSHTPYFSGSLDEFAIFDRSLSANEIRNLYVRGAAQLRFQARTCDLADCSDGGSFVGPGGSPSAYYSEAANPSLGLPEVTLDGLPTRRYFQYQVLLDTANASFAPHLHRVEIGPSHGAVETQQGFCGTPSTVSGTTRFTCSLSDLDAGASATVTVQLTPTTYGLLANNAWARSDVDEHNPLNYALATPNVLPLPIQAFTVTLAGVPGLAGDPHTFTATVSPITASVPVTYMWQATNQVAITQTGGLSNTNVFTWFTGGPQVVTVTAVNAANVISGTPPLTATLAFTVNNPVPHLTAINPASALIDSGPVTLVITGSRFVGTSQVEWNGSEFLSSTVASSTRITATVPMTLLTTAGVYPIRIFNPAPGGGYSPAGETISFTVNYPTPTNLVFNPASVVAGGNGFDLVVTGSNFYPNAQLYFNGVARASVVDTATQTLTATILAADINVAATRQVTITNPTPNTGPSASRPFTVTALGLTLQPPSISIGLNAQATITATINAVQAANRTLTLVSSSPLITVPASVQFPAGSTQITFTVGSSGLGATATITGTLPANQGGGQDTVLVTGLNPTPVITGTNPITATAGGVTLTSFQIFATNVVTGVQVYWNGTLLPSTLTGGIIDAQVSASLIQFANTAVITAVNPAPNTGASAGFLFTTTLPTLTLNPASVSTSVNSSVVMSASTNTARANPTVVTLTTSSALVASVPATVTIPAGASSVNFTLQPVGAGSATITGTLPAAYGLVSDTASVTVNNLAPVITSISPLSVTAGSGNFTLIINGSGFVGNSQVFHDSTQFSPGQVTFVNSATLNVSVPNSVIASAGIISITVFNGPPPAGGLTSNALTLTVNNLAPTMTQVSPQTRTVGGPNFTLTVTGTNFVSGAQLYFGGQAHATTVSSATRLTTTILASDIDTIGTVAITLTNPAPALPSPSSVPFTVTQLALSLAPTNPMTLPVGTPGTLTATLSAVQANATVVTLTTNSNPPGSLAVPLTVSMPAGQLSLSFPVTPVLSGTTTIQGDLPTSLGGSSNLVTVNTVDVALAGLTLLNGSPKDLAPSVFITFTASLASGTNPTIRWDWGDGSSLGVGPGPSHAYSPVVGQFYTVVVTASNSINTITGTTLVQINNLTPTLTAMSPTSTTSGLGSFTIVLTGTNFAAGSQIEWNGSSSLITPSVISGGTVMTATVDVATYIPTPNTDYQVRVVAPSPPGPSLLQRRHSNALTFRRN